MRIVIAGAGLIGVTTAYYLNKSGYDVTVIDRAQESASECSFANGGQLSYSHVEPWANPYILKKIPSWFFSNKSPLIARFKFDLQMWEWVLRFALSCNEQNVLSTIKNLQELSLSSKDALDEIIEDTKVKFDHSQTGILRVFTNEKLFEQNLRYAKYQKDIGIDFEQINSFDGCCIKEPSLKKSTRKIIGGLYFPDDGSGDAKKFTVNLTEYLKSRDVKFLYNTEIKNIECSNGRAEKIHTNNETILADKFIISLGSYSYDILKSIGIKTPLYPVKGYSISVDTQNSSDVPKIGVTDQENRVVYSRIGNILRAAGLAEFAGYNTEINQKRILLLKSMVRELFPNCKNIDNASQWSCLRPMTYDGLPIIGKTKYENIYVNTGQGSLGWTLAAGSAKQLSNIIK